MAWYPGMVGGRALGPLLFGDGISAASCPSPGPCRARQVGRIGRVQCCRPDHVHHRDGYHLGYRHFDCPPAPAAVFHCVRHSASRPSIPSDMVSATRASSIGHSRWTAKTTRRRHRRRHPGCIVVRTYRVANTGTVWMARTTVRRCPVRLLPDTTAAPARQGAPRLLQGELRRAGKAIQFPLRYRNRVSLYPRPGAVYRVSHSHGRRRTHQRTIRQHR